MCQTLLRFRFCLAQHRRLSPSGPSEPWLKGVHPTQAEWEKTRSNREIVVGGTDYLHARRKTAAEGQ